MTLPAFAAERRRLQQGARSCRSISTADAGAQQQTRRSQLLQFIDGTYRQRSNGHPFFFFLRGPQLAVVK